MYRQWPFFHATLDNAALALAKTDLAVMRHYLALTGDSESMGLIAQLIADEYESCRRAVLRITGQQQLLDDTQWLQHSIQYRNRYLDPLNMLQVELLRRLRSHEGPDDSPIVEELRHLTRLTIKGLAAGMRTTG
jgi:phosphoenolpyruvate carboxylase